MNKIFNKNNKDINKDASKDKSKNKARDKSKDKEKFKFKPKKEQNISEDITTSSPSSSNIKSKKVLPKDKPILSEDEAAAYTFNYILAGASGIGLLCGLVTLGSAVMYNPSQKVSVDTSTVSNYKAFVENIDEEKYIDLVAKHNNETQNTELDIKRVNSNIGREYPFTAILNRFNENVTTKLTKFIYTELQPAIVSYMLANGGLIPYSEEIPSEDGYYDVDLSLLDALLNIRDATLSSYKYKVKKIGGNSNVSIKVYDNDKEVPIILFDAAKFKIKSLSADQASLDYGNNNLVLGLKEEFNNIRLDKIVYKTNEKYVVLTDTLTNKQVMISKL